MIFIPKYTDIHTEISDAPTGIRGDVRIKKYDINMNLLQDTGWIKNQITDFGMLSMTNDGAFAAYTYIGSGASVPDVTDTSMDVFQADSNSDQATERNQTPVAPFYEKWNQKTRRFLANNPVTNTTIREVGLGSNTVGGELFCRQLVTPEVQKNTDQIVDVIWRITKYPNLNDINGTAVLDGVTYSTLLRPLWVTPHNDFTGTFAQVKAYNATSGYQVSDALLVPYTNSSLGGNTDNASNGGSDGPSGWVTPNTVAGRDMYHVWTLNDGNLTNGIRTLSVHNTGPDGYAQVQFTANDGPDPGGTIPKDNTKQLNLTWRTSWERRP